MGRKTREVMQKGAGEAINLERLVILGRTTWQRKGSHCLLVRLDKQQPILRRLNKDCKIM